MVLQMFSFVIKLVCSPLSPPHLLVVVFLLLGAGVTLLSLEWQCLLSHMVLLHLCAVA